MFIVDLRLQLCAAINADDARASFAAARLVYQRMQALQVREMTSIRHVSFELPQHGRQSTSWDLASADGGYPLTRYQLTSIDIWRGYHDD